MEYQAYEQFEYRVTSVSNNERSLEKYLNTLGKEGWELVSYQPKELNCNIILKRKLECTNIINE